MYASEDINVASEGILESCLHANFLYTLTVFFLTIVFVYYIIIEQVFMR